MSIFCFKNLLTGDTGDTGDTLTRQIIYGRVYGLSEMLSFINTVSPKRMCAFSCPSVPNMLIRLSYQALQPGTLTEKEAFPGLLGVSPC